MATRSTFMWLLGFTVLVTLLALVCTFDRTNAEPKALASHSAEVIQTSSTGNQHLIAKQTYEDHWRAKIERALGFVSGVVVAVDVTLSAETLCLEKSLANESPRLIHTACTRTPCESGNAELYSASPLPFETETSSDGTVVDSLPNVNRTIERTLFTPKVVTAAISAPRAYLRQVLRLRGEDEEADPTRLKHLELEFSTQIEKIAVALIPKAPPGEDTYPRVTLIWHDDLDTESGTP